MAEKKELLLMDEARHLMVGPSPYVPADSGRPARVDKPVQWVKEGKGCLGWNGGRMGRKGQ